MSPLDIDVVRSQIDAKWNCGVQVFASLSSTNAWVLEQSKQLIPPHLCAAETQTAGRGRRGKSWQSPQQGVTFSLLYKFDLLPAELTGLSLAAGCAIVTVLEQYTAAEIKLKWPNDVLCGGEKLCGLLIEMSAAEASGTNTVTGIGLNYSGVGEADNIDQPYTDLAQQLDGALPTRDILIGQLTDEILSVYQQYQLHGFQLLRSSWEKYDAYVGKPIVLTQANGSCINGIACGVAENGALKINVDGRQQEYFSGEVSVRLQQ